MKRKTYSDVTGDVEFIGHRSFEEILCVSIFQCNNILFFTLLIIVFLIVLNSYISNNYIYIIICSIYCAYSIYYDSIIKVDGSVSIIGYASKRSDGRIIIESSPELENGEDVFKVFAITGGVTLEDIEAEKRARGRMFLEVGAGFGVAALGMLAWIVTGALKRGKITFRVNYNIYIV